MQTLVVQARFNRKNSNVFMYWIAVLSSSDKTLPLISYILGILSINMIISDYLWLPDKNKCSSQERFLDLWIGNEVYFDLDAGDCKKLFEVLCKFVCLNLIISYPFLFCLPY